MNSDLLSASILATESAEGDRPRLERFLEAASPAKALAIWFDGDPPAGRDAIVLRLSWEIAQLDRILSEQTNAIIHHPAFRALEASWRGLYYLWEQARDAENVKIRLLSLSWRELTKDMERAIEFDQSQLFRLVYTEEFDMPGGEPFGVLLGDYSVQHRPSTEHPTDDIGTLGGVSEVAAAAFAPFIAAADSGFLGLESFRDLERPIDLPRIFSDRAEYTKWSALRDRHDSRFVGLVLPRVLMRAPYSDFVGRADGFRFIEELDGPDSHLWGNAVYAFGAVLIRNFSDCGWLAGIRGVERDMESAGIVTGLPVDYFTTDRYGLHPKPSPEVMITDTSERELSSLGFIPLCHCHGTDLAAFYSTPSIQRPRKFDEPDATVNSRISAMLHYMLCVSRFAHYIKVMGRECVGSFSTADECESFLNKWLLSFATANEGVSTEIQARYPLREAKVQVRETPGKPGVFSSTIHLRPHFQFDKMTTAVTLVTELYLGRDR